MWHVAYIAGDAVCVNAAIEINVLDYNVALSSVTGFNA